MAKSNSPPSEKDARGARHSRFEVELRRGVIQMVALRLLKKPRYGYDLIRHLGRAGFSIEEGTLYPLLRRFEKNGLVTSRWDTGGTRPRKYYELTGTGASELVDMLEVWSRVNVAANDALTATPVDSSENASDDDAYESSDGAASDEAPASVAHTVPGESA